MLFTNRQRIDQLQARVDVLERQIVEVKRTQLAKLSDAPPTIEHQYAIIQVLRLARELAVQHPGDISGEIINWLDAMGQK